MGSTYTNTTPTSTPLANRPLPPRPTAEATRGSRPRSPLARATTAPLAEDRPGQRSNRCEDDVVVEPEGPTAQFRASSGSRPQPTSTSGSGPARPSPSDEQVRPNSPYRRFAPNPAPTRQNDLEEEVYDDGPRVAPRAASYGEAPSPSSASSSSSSQARSQRPPFHGSDRRPSRPRPRPESRPASTKQPESDPKTRRSATTEPRPAPAQQQRSDTAEAPLPTSVQAPPASPQASVRQARESMEMALEIARNYIDAFTAGTELGRSAGSFTAAAAAEAAVATTMRTLPSASVLNNLKRKSYGGRASSSAPPATKKPRRKSADSGSPNATPSGPKRERPTNTSSSSSDNTPAVCGYRNCQKQRIHGFCRNRMCSVHCRDAQTEGSGQACSRHPN